MWTIISIKGEMSMAESKAYYKAVACPFIKFVDNPKQYYLDRIKYYISKVESSEQSVEKLYKEIIASTRSHISELNSENGTRWQLGDAETMHLLAYVACNRAWIEAGCTYPSYPSTIPAKINMNQAISVGYVRKNSYGEYEPDPDRNTFFNQMDDNLLDILSEESNQALLSASYYGQYPVIDIDRFNHFIHSTINEYHAEAEKAGHNIKNSKTPNKKFLGKIENAIDRFDSSLTEVTRHLDFTKKNPLSF